MRSMAKLFTGWLLLHAVWILETSANSGIPRSSRQDETEPVHVSCGTHRPSDADMKARDRAVQFRAFRQNQQRQPNLRSTINADAIKNNTAFQKESETPRVIPVCFHVLSNPLNRILRLEHASNKEIQRQLDHLNHAFSANSCCDTSLSWCNGECSVETNIRFTLAKKDWRGRLLPGQTTGNARNHQACITRRVRLITSFRQYSRRERRMISKLRKGGPDVLNIFLVRPKIAILPPLLSGLLLGHASFPWDYAGDPDVDSVVVRPSTLPGGRFPTKGEGDTLVHEVGHWLGLYHTFDLGCVPGDYVADTPAQDQAGENCPVGRDTCSGDDLDDPIHGFMDYTSDECQFQWTQGQVNVMHACLDAYRSSDDDRPISAPPITLKDGIPSEPSSLAFGRLRSFQLPNVPPESIVFCQATADNGNLELLVNWDGSLTDFDCQAASFSTSETCFTKSSTGGTVYAMVYASFTIADFSVNCQTLQTENSIALDNDGVLFNFQVSNNTLQPFTLDTSPDTELKTVECQVATTLDTGVGSVILAMGRDASMNTKGRNSACVDIKDTNGGASTLILGCKLDFDLADTVYIWVTTVGIESPSPSDLSISCSKDTMAGAIQLSDSMDTSDTYSLAAAGEGLLFFLPVLQPVGYVTCTATASKGNLGLEMMWTPTDVGGDCRRLGGSGEPEQRCTIGPGSGLAFATVVAVDTGNVDFTIRCTFQAPQRLVANGQTTAKMNIQSEEMKVFSVAVPSASYVKCETSILFDRQGDVDLMMNWDGDTNLFRCRSQTATSREVCWMGPGSGTAYVFVYGYDDTEKFRLRCWLSNV